MKIRVHLFGFVAEAAGRTEVTVEASTAGEVVAGLRKTLDLPKSVRVAVNEEYAGPKRKLRKGDVVSLIPPVAGG